MYLANTFLPKEIDRRRRRRRRGTGGQAASGPHLTASLVCYKSEVHPGSMPLRCQVNDAIPFDGVGKAGMAMSTPLKVVTSVICIPPRRLAMLAAGKMSVSLYAPEKG